MPLERIISGGQTGVDRAALDAAQAVGIPCGGWCPKGRCAEDGTIHARYPLRETPSEDYAQRTEWNVRDSDGTLIITRGQPTGGTGQTISFARKLGRPLLIIDLDQSADMEPVRAWIETNNIRTLNIAGPRESTQPGIYKEARAFLDGLLSARYG